MKKATWLLLVGALLVGLTVPGCSSSSGKLTVATDATWPPFEYVNTDTKEIEGFDIDVMKAIAEKAGLDIEFVNVGWDPLLAGMAQGTYDLAISSITITEERKQDMLFSDPYFAAGQMVIVGVDNTTITGPTSLSGVVGAQIGTTGAFEIEKVAAATLKTYDDIGLAVQDLMNGQIVAVVCDNPVALGYAGEYPDKVKTVGDVFTDEYYGVAAAKGNEAVVAKINTAIAALEAEGKFEELIKKWL
ncbi:MAG: basic amino acid ABC transporter substrate-binding protein [Dehalococcoidia bacterium]|nr:MAG: basic amino acid ABC transporter substrate-binding protein [Dehalococcoidia bacterium]